MSIKTYKDLKAALARWLKRTNLGEHIPDFIELAEARLNRILRVRQMQATATCMTDQRQIALPEDYLETVVVTVDGRRLDFVQRHLVGDNEPRYQKHFSIAGSCLRVHVPPQTLYKISLLYYERLRPLTEKCPSNWLLSNGPDIYLYASLLEAEPYIKNDQRIPIWREALTIALSDIQANDERGRFSGAPLMIQAG
ncbi:MULTISPECIES: phage adaptor protein [Mycetohabitans]|uniref:phage adaptor protein n=1 Tax=Mycetohabitans TaxID=2571159 RepID=UPI001F38FBBC|nr:hypothetical protein [Mycetohabitans sp. B3]MCF2133873.1 hypothetical protein [Mycetohabitans sp. B3]